MKNWRETIKLFTIVKKTGRIIASLEGAHDTQHNYTQHHIIECELSITILHATLSITTLSIPYNDTQHNYTQHHIIEWDISITILLATALQHSV
jgi:hypothetical protein